MNIAPKSFPSQSFPHIFSLLSITPLSFLHSFSKDDRWGQLKRAFGPPRSPGKTQSGDLVEEKRDSPFEMQRWESGRGFGAENWRVVPVDVAGNLGGYEELRMEGWCGCRVGYDMGQSMDSLLPCRVFHFLGIIGVLSPFSPLRLFAGSFLSSVTDRQQGSGKSEYP